MSATIRKDSAYSWLVLFVVVLSQVALGGICLNGGIFYIIFRNNLGTEAVETSWLCSMPITLWCYASPIGSFLTNRYGCRSCTFIGGLMAALGLSLGYFTNSFVFLFITYGVLSGVGFGISYTGCMSSVNIYFDKYKTMALGLASVGHNLGQIVFLELCLGLEATFGYKGMLLNIGAVTSNLCAFALLMRPENKSEARKSGSGDLDNMTTHTKDRVRNKRKATNLSIFRNVSFISFCASNIMVNMGQAIYRLYIPSYWNDAGLKPEHIGLLWLVNGLLNIIGKVLFSFLGHHPRVNTTVLYTVSIAFTGVCFGLTPILPTKSGLLLTAALNGLFYNVTGSLMQAVIYTIVGYERFTDGVGMSFPFKGTGNLLGGPIAGVLYTASGNYATSFYLGGVIMMCGAIFLLYPTLQSIRDHKDKRMDNTVYENELIDSGEESNLLLSRTGAESLNLEDTNHGHNIVGSDWESSDARQMLLPK